PLESKAPPLTPFPSSTNPRPKRQKIHDACLSYSSTSSQPPPIPTAASSSAATSPFPFLKLHPELRLRIYLLTLTLPSSGIEISTHSGPSNLEEIVGSVEDFDEEIDLQSVSLAGLQLRDGSDYFTPALLSISRQVYSEASAVLYGRNQFCFKKWCIFHCFLRLCSVATLGQIRMIRICFPVAAENFSVVQRLGFVERGRFNFSWAKDARNLFRLLTNLQSVMLDASYDLREHFTLDAWGWLKEIPEKCNVVLYGRYVEGYKGTATEWKRCFRKPILCEKVVEQIESNGSNLFGARWTIGGDFATDKEELNWMPLEEAKRCLTSMANDLRYLDGRRLSELVEVP
ncbi:MAG: hypothetical protein MMC33_010355, partial [Icmadophila ericetorum]|nr:hypothetical protein [Icmadophila ericetorum]